MDSMKFLGTPITKVETFINNTKNDDELIEDYYTYFQMKNPAVPMSFNDYFWAARTECDIQAVNLGYTQADDMESPEHISSDTVQNVWECRGTENEN